MHPNDASTVVNHAPNGNPRRLTITPSTELEDGDVVTFSGSGFSPDSSVYYCQALMTGSEPTPSDCGSAVRLRPSRCHGLLHAFGDR